jgi:hypothetical protein
MNIFIIFAIWAVISIPVTVVLLSAFRMAGIVSLRYE